MKHSPALQGFHLLLTALGLAFIKAKVCSSAGKRSLLYLYLPASPRQANLAPAKTQIMKAEKNKDPCPRLAPVPGSEVPSQPRQLPPASPPLAQTLLAKPMSYKAVKILSSFFF